MIVLICCLDNLWKRTSYPEKPGKQKENTYKEVHLKQRRNQSKLYTAALLFPNVCLQQVKGGRLSTLQELARGSSRKLSCSRSSSVTYCEWCPHWSPVQFLFSKVAVLKNKYTEALMKGRHFNLRPHVDYYTQTRKEALGPHLTGVLL